MSSRSIKRCLVSIYMKLCGLSFFFCGFSQLSTAKAPSPIYTHNTSYDAVQRYSSINLHLNPPIIS